jgi:geranylgeranyl transferase type-1 subunit beta
MDFVSLHKKYFQMNLKSLPHHYTGSDSNRLTLGMFAVMAMDLLGCSEDSTIHTQKKGWIDWIYSLQTTYNANGVKSSGFRGGSTIGTGPTQTSVYDTPHLANTYAGLLTLLILGDDLSRVDRCSVIGNLRFLQQDDGRFCKLNQLYTFRN